MRETMLEPVRESIAQLVTSNKNLLVEFQNGYSDEEYAAALAEGGIVVSAKGEFAMFDTPYISEPDGEDGYVHSCAFCP
jgi:hypothetical protein